MALSMYESSIPVLKHTLKSLAAILAKSAAHAASKKIDPGVLAGARLFPDMFNLAKQVQIATDQAKGCAARLAGIDIPKFEDNETSFEELQARIAKTDSQAPQACSKRIEAGLIAETRRSMGWSRSNRCGACAPTSTTLNPDCARRQAAAAPTMPPPIRVTSAFNGAGIGVT